MGISVYTNEYSGQANLRPEIDYEKLELPERWILSRLTKMIEDYNDHLDRFRFNETQNLCDFCKMIFAIGI